MSNERWRMVWASAVRVTTSVGSVTWSCTAFWIIRWQHAICFAVLWFALNNWLTVFPLLLIALILSSILSIFVLRAARDRLAGKIETRATKISTRLEQARSAEDDD